jgi:hypothetical protein
MNVCRKEFQMRQHYLIMMLIGAIAVGCGSDDTTSVPTERRVPLYDLVDANCLAVETAVYRFALDNDDFFPADVSDVNNAGKVLSDYLPDGSMLINPYTHEATEPHDLVQIPYEQKNGWTEYCPWDANGDLLVEAFVIWGYTAIEAEPSQPQIWYCGAPEESGLCFP